MTVTEISTDVAVVGAGVAGLVAALDLRAAMPDVTVAILDKGAIGSGGSTPLAQGGMAAAVGPADSADLHARDTVATGDGLSDVHAVRVVASEAPARVDDLVRWGVRFDREPGGGLALSREGGQSVARSVRAADATGAEIFRALRTAARGAVRRLQGIAWRLAQASDGTVTGVWALLDDLDGQPAGLVLVRARAVLLATGGCGGLYAATTNRDAATADGVALAHAAGAAVQDLEFVQFHPTGLKVAAEGFWRLLLTEALRGAGATLLDERGHRFMTDVHPDAELAPRHIVTRAMLDQPGGVWLDAMHLGEDRLAEEFPTALDGARRYGYDLPSEPVPVEPCQHYMIGGVWTDLRGRTSIPGLYAAGEVACTGMHGASRMAGNSLAEACVFAHRVAADLARGLPEPREPDGEPPALDGGTAPLQLRGQVRTAMSAGAGPVRTGASLDEAAAVLDDAAAVLGTAAAARRENIELHHLVTAARLVVTSARLRTESRGAHWRDDHPQREPVWDDVRLRR